MSTAVKTLLSIVLAQVRNDLYTFCLAPIVLDSLCFHNRVNESFLLVECLFLKAFGRPEELIFDNDILLADIHQLLLEEPFLEGFMCIAMLFRLE